ncbi:MAG: GNAT family N-acetyltransferase [Bacteroidetes bacterium]|nr:GNAT family N-acetyltransferase [Bacteroidota bacterium]
MNYLFETTRCRMREMQPEDGSVFYELNLDPDVLKYTGDEPFKSVEEATTFLKNYDVYRKYGMGRWVVERKEDGVILGWCGLKFLVDEQEVDIGYRFFRKYWGKGYASETACASIDYGFNTLKLARIIGRSAVANLASVRVLEKCGLKFEKFSDALGEETVQHAISKAEYVAYRKMQEV